MVKWQNVKKGLAMTLSAAMVLTGLQFTPLTADAAGEGYYSITPGSITTVSVDKEVAVKGKDNIFYVPWKNAQYDKLTAVANGKVDILNSDVEITTGSTVLKDKASSWTVTVRTAGNVSIGYKLDSNVITATDGATNIDGEDDQLPWNDATGTDGLVYKKAPGYGGVVGTDKNSMTFTVAVTGRSVEKDATINTVASQKLLVSEKPSKTSQEASKDSLVKVIKDMTLDNYTLTTSDIESATYVEKDANNVTATIRFGGNYSGTLNIDLPYVLDPGITCVTNASIASKLEYTGNDLKDEIGKALVVTHAAVEGSQAKGLTYNADTDGFAIKSVSDDAMDALNSTDYGWKTVTVYDKSNKTMTATCSVFVKKATVTALVTDAGLDFDGTDTRTGAAFTEAGVVDLAATNSAGKPMKLTTGKALEISGDAIDVGVRSGYAILVSKEAMNKNIEGGASAVPFDMKINPISLTNDSIVIVGVTPASFTAPYSTEAITAEAIVTMKSSKVVVPSKYYSVGYDDNVKAGTAKVIVTDGGVGAFLPEFTGTANFDIDQATFADGEWNIDDLEIEDQNYTGEKITPEVGTIKYNDKELTIDKDYFVTYKNNKNVNRNGKTTPAAIITLTGDNFRQESKTDVEEIPFNILALSLEDAEVEIPSSGSIKGSEKSPAEPEVAVVVTSSGKTIELVNNVDYTVEYFNNTGAGVKAGEEAEGTVVITAKENGNFEGETTETFKYTAGEDEPEPEPEPVTPSGSLIDISSADITLSAKTATYNGKEQKPSVTKVTVSGGEVTLKEGTDYTVDFGTGNYTDAGSYTVKVAAKEGADAKYTNAASVTYTIEAQDFSTTAKMTVNPTTVTLPKTGVATTSAIVTLGDQTLVADKDYTLTFADNTKAGTAKAIATGKGNYKGSVQATFTVKDSGSTTSKKNIKNATVKLAKTKYAYTGKAIKPAVKSVKIGKTTLKYKTDYTVSYKNNKKVGKKAQVIIKAAKNSKKYTGSKTIKFQITKGKTTVKLSPTKLSAKKLKKKNQTIKVKVTGSKGKVSVTIPKKLKKKLKFNAKKKTITVKKNKKAKKGLKYTFTVKVKAKGSFNKATKKFTVKLNK
jgi:hypothetical protein